MKGRRSGTAQAAQHRNAGPMKHRLEPRGGSKNEMDELLEELEVSTYTREEAIADLARVTTAIAAKHGITESEVPELIRTHSYEHSEEDIEDEYIQIMAFLR